MVWLDMGTWWWNNDGYSQIHDYLINTYSVPIQSWAPYVPYLWILTIVLDHVEESRTSDKCNCLAKASWLVSRGFGIWTQVSSIKEVLPIPVKTKGKGSG